MAKPQGFGSGDIERRRRLPLAGQDVEHDIAADRAAAERLGASGLDRLDPIACHRRENADHLAVAIDMAAEAAANPLDRWRQSLNGAPFLSAPGLRASTGR